MVAQPVDLFARGNDVSFQKDRMELQGSQKAERHEDESGHSDSAMGLATAGLTSQRPTSTGSNLERKITGERCRASH
jgi:hypothetical protein